MDTDKISTHSAWQLSRNSLKPSRPSTGQPTRPPLLLCLRCEQGAWARAQPYDLGSIAHNIASRNSRLVLLCLVIHWVIYLLFIITLGWNIIGPARRREKGTYGDGGEDEGGAGGSAEDGGDVLVHAEPWRRTGSCSTTSVVPSSWPCSLPYPVGIKILVLHNIYSSGLTHAITSLCRDNWRHRTTLTDRPALHEPVQPPTSLMTS
jgi:hypothetical protein